MANIFAILTAVVLAVSAFLAYQNMGREGEPGRGYKGWLTKTKDEQDALARKRAQLKATQEELDQTSAELADFESKNTKLQADLDAQLAVNKDLDEQVVAKESEAQRKATEVSSKKKSLEDLGDIDQVLAQLKQTQTEIAQLDLDIAQGQAQLAALEAQRLDVDRALGDVRERIKWRVSGKSDPSLTTSVRSVYQNLGFVTLAGGDNLGIVKDSQLEVVRDGAVVAKLQVTAVEATTSAADIVPDSLEPGDSVRAGDRIRSSAESDAAPAVAAPGTPAAPPAAAPAPAPGNPDPAEDLPDSDPFPAPDAEPGLDTEPAPAPDAEPDAEPGVDSEPAAEEMDETDPFN